MAKENITYQSPRGDREWNYLLRIAGLDKKGHRSIPNWMKNGGLPDDW